MTISELTTKIKTSGREFGVQSPVRLEVGWEAMHAIRESFAQGKIFRIDSFSCLPIEMKEYLPPCAVDVYMCCCVYKRLWLK